MITEYKNVNGKQVKLSAEELNELRVLQEKTTAAKNLVKYKDDRRSEYPEIGDQLDVIWRYFDTLTLTAEAQSMLDQVKAVKAKYPKPTEE